jgi:hypothetical protein
MRPNTILLGWPGHCDRAKEFGEMLRTVAGLNSSIIAIRFHGESDDPWHAPSGTIDVWWRGKANGALLLLLAHLLSQNKEWRGRPIRLLRCVSNPDASDDVKRNLAELIDQARIRARAVVVCHDNVQSAIQEQSHGAAIVLLGFDPPAENDETEFYARMESLGGDLQRVVLVHSVGGMTLES